MNNIEAFDIVRRTEPTQEFQTFLSELDDGIPANTGIEVRGFDTDLWRDRPAVNLLKRREIAHVFELFPPDISTEDIIDTVAADVPTLAEELTILFDNPRRHPVRQRDEYFAVTPIIRKRRRSTGGSEYLHDFRLVNERREVRTSLGALALRHNVPFQPSWMSNKPDMTLVYIPPSTPRSKADAMFSHLQRVLRRYQGSIAVEMQPALIPGLSYSFGERAHH